MSSALEALYYPDEAATVDKLRRLLA